MRNAKSRRANQILVAAAAAGVMGFAASTEAAVQTWKNTGTSFTTAGNWNSGLPGTSDTAFFDSFVVGTQTATLDGSLTIGGLRFGVSTGSTALTATLISSSSSNILTLTSVGGGTSSALALGSGVAPVQNATVDANIALIAGNQAFYSFASAGTLTVSGVISGGSASNTLTLYGNNTTLRQISITGTDNSFASKPVISTRVLAGKLGNAGNNGSLGTYGTIQLTGALLVYTGPGETTDRNIDVLGGSTISNNNNTLGNTLTLAGNINSTATSGTKRLDVWTAGASIVDVTGLISNGTTGALVGVHSAGGLVKLSNTNNSFTGGASVRGGTLEVAKIGISGENSPLGTGATFRFGVSASPQGTLRYVGIGETTDKIIEFNNQASGTSVVYIEASGSTTVASPLIFTANLAFNANSVGVNQFGLGGTGAGEFQGSIGNSGTGTSITHFSKVGGSTWKLTNNNTYSGPTAISGGTLRVNGTHTAAGAYSTSNAGSILGGGGTITTASNAGVTLATGGGLSPGASAGEKGDLTLNLGTGTLNISAIAPNNLGRLAFDLGSIATSDQIILGAGSILNIGTTNPTTKASLDWSDFTFTALSGLENGVYTLFDTSAPIVGVLSSSSNALTGAIGAGTGLLAVSGNDLILTVTGVPEPSSAIGLVGIGALAAVRRRRRN